MFAADNVDTTSIDEQSANIVHALGDDIDPTAEVELPTGRRTTGAEINRWRHSQT